MDEEGRAYASKVSPQEAGSALEALTNLLFLTAQCADDEAMVRRFVTETESCVTKLTQYLRPHLASVHQMRSAPQSERIKSRA